MPSPVGHAIAGAAAGWLVTGPPTRRPFDSPGTRQALMFAVLGMAPDLDLLTGNHSGPSHSVGMMLAVGLAMWTVAPRLAPELARHLVAAACMFAYGSHLLLDWLGQDTTPPIGIMALWPFSDAYYQSSLGAFMAVSRRYYQGAVFWQHNLLALARELAILVPLAVLVAYATRRSR